MSQATPIPSDTKQTSVCEGLTVLMATYNGASFLPEQLRSLKDQTLRPSRLVVSDDRSTDDTVKVIQKETSSWSDCKVDILRGPGLGPWQNFNYLLKNIPADATVVALSDQDDSWLPTKLEDAFSTLGKIDPATPALFGSATWICTENLVRLRLSRKMVETPHFGHALTQNFAGGNTMVLNEAATVLVRETQPLVDADVVPDWWLYLLVSGVGGEVYFSAKPSVLYRQHKSNVIGSNLGIFAAVGRARKMLGGQYAHWNDANIRSLGKISERLKAENLNRLEQLRQARASSMPMRLWKFYRTDIRRHGLIGQLGFWASVVLGKF